MKREYETSYKWNEESEVEFYSPENFNIIQCDVEITAPTELWEKFKRGEVLIDPIDIGCEKDPWDALLDNNCIFMDAKKCFAYFDRTWSGKYLNCFGEGVLYEYENTYFNFLPIKLKKVNGVEMTTVRVTLK